MATEFQVLVVEANGLGALLDERCSCGPDCDDRCDFAEFYDDWCYSVSYWTPDEGYPRELAILRWGTVVHWPEDPADKLLVAAVLAGMKG